jgi:hypothetical protein
VAFTVAGCSLGFLGDGDASEEGEGETAQIISGDEPDGNRLLRKLREGNGGEEGDVCSCGRENDVRKTALALLLFSTILTVCLGTFKFTKYRKLPDAAKTIKIIETIQLPQAKREARLLLGVVEEQRSLESGE